MNFNNPFEICKKLMERAAGQAHSEASSCQNCGLFSFEPLSKKASIKTPFYSILKTIFGLFQFCKHKTKIL